MSKIVEAEDGGNWLEVNDRGDPIRSYHDESAAAASHERLTAGPARRTLALVPAASDWLDGFRAGYLEGSARHEDTWLHERVRSYRERLQGGAGRFRTDSLDPYESRYWLLGLLGIRPEKQPDRAFDGRLVFYDEGLSGRPKCILIAARPGRLTTRDVLDMKEALTVHDAAIGVLLTEHPAGESVTDLPRRPAPIRLHGRVSSIRAFRFAPPANCSRVSLWSTRA